VPENQNFLLAVFIANPLLFVSKQLCNTFCQQVHQVAISIRALIIKTKATYHITRQANINVCYMRLGPIPNLNSQASSPISK